MITSDTPCLVFPVHKKQPLLLPRQEVRGGKMIPSGLSLSLWNWKDYVGNITPANRIFVCSTGSFSSRLSNCMLLSQEPPGRQKDWLGYAKWKESRAPVLIWIKSSFESRATGMGLFWLRFEHQFFAAFWGGILDTRAWKARRLWRFMWKYALEKKAENR